MKDLLVTRLTLVWLLLVVITGLSWFAGHGAGFDSPRTAGMAILILAFFKVRLVLLEFMELRHAPKVLRAMAEAWALGICALLLTLYAAPALH